MNSTDTFFATVDSDTAEEVLSQIESEKYPDVVLEAPTSFEDTDEIQHLFDELAAMGYSVDYEILSPHLLPQGGIPVDRPRAYIRASKRYIPSFGFLRYTMVAREEWVMAEWRAEYGESTPEQDEAEGQKACFRAALTAIM